MSDQLRKATAKDLALLVFLALIWGSAFQAIKVTVPETGPLWLVASRVVIALCALLPWTLFRGIIWPQGAQQWRLILGIVLLNILAPFTLISWAEQSISSGETALLLGIGPLVGLISSHLTTNDDKLTRRKILAVFVGFCGVALVIGVDAFRALGSNLPAQVAVLMASVCYVTSGLLVRRVEGIPPARMTAITYSISALVIVPLAFLQAPLPTELSATAFWSMIYLGLVPTGVAAILRFHLIRKLGVSMFSHVGNMIPVVGVALGALLLNEPIGIVTIAALALILTGVGLARSGR